MSPYAQTTWSTLQTQAQNRLDTKGIFYTNAGLYPEITLYLREALRVWNCLSNHYRERFTFNTTTNLAWYDLHNQVGNPANLMAKTVLDTDLVAEIQLHLMETVSPNIWIGTDMFTLDLVTQALQRRRDQFLLDTGVEQVRTVAALTIPAEGRFDMPHQVIDIRRLEWVNLAGTRTHLWRTDEWNAQAHNPGSWYLNPLDPPTQFSTILTHPLGVQLIPPAALDGQLDRLTVDSGAALNPTVGILMGVPDDWAWVIKWGAMADLLGLETQARDPERAAYCEKRYQEGITLANLAPIAMFGQINGIPVPVISLHDLDTHRPGWPNETAGIPDVIAVSQYMLAVAPPPNSNTISITVDVLRPAPIPATGATFVTLGLEELNAIIDYAHHIGTFKEAGGEFKATQRQYDNMVRLAALRNDRLNAAFFREVLEDRAQREETRRPRRTDSGGD